MAIQAIASTNSFAAASDDDFNPYSSLAGEWRLIDNNGGLGKTVIIQDFDESNKAFYYSAYEVCDLFYYPTLMRFSYDVTTSDGTAKKMIFK